MNKSLIESMRNIFENDNEKNITIPDIDQKYKDMIHKFIDFTNQFLELKTLPDIEFVQERGDIPMTTGSYIPDQNKLYILIRNRAICDYLRTLAHELVHYKQQEDGKIPDNLQGRDEELEAEANIKAGKIVYDFAHSGNEELYEM